MVDGGRDGSEAVLDLSAWPQQPAAPAQVRRTGLPPRPVRRRRLIEVGLGRLAAGALGLATVLLAVPLPGTGCPSALSVWTAAPRPLPSATAPSLDDAAVTADGRAVAAARSALAVHDARVVAARRVLASPEPAPAKHRAGAATGDVTALEAAVRSDTADRDQAQSALDSVVEQQQAADDPSAYDDQVAAAQEDLDVAEARLAADQQALAEARRAGAAASPAPAPAPASSRGGAQAVVDQAAAVRAGLVQELARAEQAQAQHLAQRRDQLAAWAGRHEHAVAAIRTANAHLAACEGTVRAPGAAGSLLGVTGVGLLLLRRRRP